MANKKIIWLDLAKSKFKDILEFYIEINKSVTYSLKPLGETEDLLKTLSKVNLLDD